MSKCGFPCAIKGQKTVWAVIQKRKDGKSVQKSGSIECSVTFFVFVLFWIVRSGKSSSNCWQSFHGLSDLASQVLIAIRIFPICPIWQVTLQTLTKFF